MSGAEVCTYYLSISAATAKIRLGQSPKRGAMHKREDGFIVVDEDGKHRYL